MKIEEFKPCFELNEPDFPVAAFKRISRLPSGTVDVGIQKGLFPAVRKRLKKDGPKRPFVTAKTIAKGRLIGALWSATRVVSSGAASLIDDPAYALANAPDGDWMWPVARAVERGEQFPIYCYATLSNDKWDVDVHVDKTLKQPEFGLKPFIFIPLWEIYSDVYKECRDFLRAENLASGVREP